MNIARSELKLEIDRLDEQYLEFIYNILHQCTKSPPKQSQKTSLLEVLATLDDIEDEFPNIDEYLLPLDDITL